VQDRGKAAATGARSRRGSLGDTAYWCGFGLYAAISTLWLLLAAVTFFIPHLVPGSGQVHGEADVLLHANDLVLSFGTLALGLYVAWLDPPNATARPFALGLVGTSAGFSLTAHHLADAVAPAATMQAVSISLVPILHVAFHVIGGVAYTYALLLFPDGNLPRLSLVSRIFWGLVLLALLVILVVPQRLPSYFILYCGIAAGFAGWISQSYKARDSGASMEERARSRQLERAFALAVVIAGALALVEYVFEWHHYLGVTSETMGDEASDQNLILTSVPPLLAGAGVVMLVGILQFRLWGVDARVTARLSKALVVLVMAGYVLTEALIHTVAEGVGESAGLGVGFAVFATAIIGVAVLDRPREYVVERCRRLSGHDSIQPMGSEQRQVPPGEFSSIVRSAKSVDAIAPALATVFRREWGITRFALAVRVTPDTRLVLSWPPGAVLPDPEIPLLRDGEYLGELTALASEAGGLERHEEQLATELAVEAALAVREVDAPMTRAPSSVPDENQSVPGAG
jgi:hypothetical protein